MEELLKLRQTARLIGVSPGRFNRAMAYRRLAAAPGGGPGKGHAGEPGSLADILQERRPSCP
jgi:hypothetical protein